MIISLSTPSAEIFPILFHRTAEKVSMQAYNETFQRIQDDWERTRHLPPFRLNGYPVSETVRQLLPLRTLSTICHYVQPCEHGPRCTQCCFAYHGPPINALCDADQLRLPYYLTFSTRYRLPSFFWLVVYGRFHRRVQHWCGDDMCVNVHHMYVKHPASWERLFQSIAACPHGIFCRECHWIWKGLHRVYKRFPNRPGETLGHYTMLYVGTTYVNDLSPQRLLYGYLFYQDLSFHDVVTRVCQEQHCCNPWHFNRVNRRVSVKRALSLSHNGILWEKRKRARNPLMIIHPSEERPTLL